MTLKATRTYLLSFVAAAFITAAPPFAAADTQTEPPEPLMKQMLEATKNRSYDEFCTECNEKMRASLTKQMFEGVSGIMAPRLKQGYKPVYLGKLRQQGHIVYLWRLEFADGKDDHLVKLSMKDGKVGGILLQ